MLNKKKYYILYTINKNGTTTETTTQLLFWNVSKLHDFLLSLTLNNGSLFILEVWKNLYKIFVISANLFIQFYLEIDKQNKIANQKKEKNFYIFVNYW